MGDKIKYFLAVMTSVMVLFISSCTEDIKTPNNEVTADIYRLKMSLSPGINTKANWVLAPGTDDDDFIGDPKFALYYDGKFLMSLDDNIEELPETNKYEVSLSPEELEEAFESKEVTFSEDLLKTQKFQILVTANWKSYTGNELSVNEDLSDLWSNDSDFNFNYKRGASDESWKPNAEQEEGIPMFGLSGNCQIIEQEEDIEVPMLRALAKIEVFDVMGIPESDYPFTIKSVKLTKSTDKGRLIPDATKNPDWNNDSKQVILPSLPSSLSNISDILLLLDTEEMTYGEGSDAITATFNKWVCYIPEMDLTAEGFKDVSLKIELNETEKQVGEILLANEIYKFERKSYVLRNGHYRFFVNILKETTEGFMAIIETEPSGDINFINISGNKWWLHKELVNGKLEEVWYKTVYHSNLESGIRSHWEKEWYYNEASGVWYKWIDGSWVGQEETSQGPYDQTLFGINTSAEFNEMINNLVGLNDYNGNVKSRMEGYFNQYGKPLEINGEVLKCIMLNLDARVENGANVLTVHKDYILYGNGHTVFLKHHGGGIPDRFNLGPVRDIFIQSPDNSEYYIYIDKYGKVTDALTGEEIGVLPKIEGTTDKGKVAVNYDIYVAKGNRGVHLSDYFP